ncbi:MAG TPA: hypothetical protein DCM87_09465 [Planctomycetes bacterium]|nr:hypothetical protein [Planctomycetota bacterium]
MRHHAFVLAVAVCAACCVCAAESDFEMAVVPAAAGIFGPANGTASGSVNLVVQMDAKVAQVQGWSFGIKLVPSAGFNMNITALKLTNDVMTCKNGAPPGFADTGFFAAGNLTTSAGKAAADGTATIGIPDCIAVTQGIVVDMMQLVSLPAVDDFGLIEITVNASGPVGAAATEAGRVVFTDEIGAPATSTVVVLSGNSFAPAVQAPAVITAVPRSCVGASPFTVNIDDAEGFGQVSSLVRLNFNADGTISEPIQGWSYGICILDTSKLAITAAVSDGTDTATAKNGAKPDFDAITLYQNAGGFTHGVVIDMMATVTVPPDTDWTDIAMTFDLLTTTPGDTVVVAPCSGVHGSPPTSNVMVIEGESIEASQLELPSHECCEGVVCNHLGVITVKEDTKSFLPGNANGDKRIDIADGIFVLSYLFRDGRVPPCMAAADFNNDGVIDLTDAIALVYYQLQPNLPGMPGGGWPAAALGTTCGKFKVDLECEIEQCD